MPKDKKKDKKEPQENVPYERIGEGHNPEPIYLVEAFELGATASTHNGSMTFKQFGLALIDNCEVVISDTLDIIEDNERKGLNPTIAEVVSVPGSKTITVEESVTPDAA